MSKAMKQDETNLVPRLRFPEFQDAGEWEPKRLGQIATLHKGKGISKSDIKIDGIQPCVRYGELYTVYGEVIDEVISKTDLSSSELFLSHEGDVIIPGSGETKIDLATAACVIQKDVALGGDLNVIRSNQNGIFLSFYLNGPLRFAIAKVAQGDTIVHLYKTQLEQLGMAIPTAREQQKIAECLSSLNALITAHTEKLDALKAHKNGLMQRLFPREGETIPRLRFPEFWDAGEWESIKLGRLFANRQESGFEILPLLSLTDKDGIIPQEESNRKNSASADRSRYLRVMPGDVAYNTMRMWEGRSAYVDREGIISPAYTVCKPVESVNGLFYSHYFKTEQLIEQFRRYSQGLVKDTLNLKYAAFAQIPVRSPRPEEQHKIADCLSSLDSLITAHTEKLDALKAHKNGLMQQLFPTMEATTA